MIEALILLFCRILIVFLLLLFIILPLSSNLFKICFKKIKSQKKDIKLFLEKEDKNV